jgi:xylose isomerase
MAKYTGKYSSKKAGELKAHSFDRQAISKRGFKYERLDQLLVELLLGVR